MISRMAPAFLPGCAVIPNPAPFYGDGGEGSAFGLREALFEIMPHGILTRDQPYLHFTLPGKSRSLTAIRKRRDWVRDDSTVLQRRAAWQTVAAAAPKTCVGASSRAHALALDLLLAHRMLLLASAQRTCHPSTSRPNSHAKPQLSPTQRVPYTRLLTPGGVLKGAGCRASTR
jgi:hypothetical protein